MTNMKLNQTIHLLFFVGLLLYLVIFTSILSLQYRSTSTILSLPYETHVIPEQITSDFDDVATGLNKKTTPPSSQIDQSRCFNTTFPGSPASVDQWYFVDKNRTTLVFSAYVLDVTVVLIGAGRRLWYTRYKAVVWYDSRSKGEIIDCTATRIDEDHGRQYSAAFFECTFSRQSSPKYIRLVASEEGCVPVTHIMKVKPTLASTYSRAFTVCLAPLNNNYNNVFGLVEWIELNRLLGADRFIVYNHSSTADVGTVLEHYKKLHIVEVMQWQMPLRLGDSSQEGEQPQIHYYGQLVALQDCLYRNKRDSVYIVVVDLDEFIIPSSDTDKTWFDIIDRLQQHNRGAYRFKNVFYRKEWANDPLNDIPVSDKDLVDKYQLVTMLKTKHDPATTYKERTKYIARTSDVDRLQVHSPYRGTAKTKLLLVPPSMATLHHYRNWQKYGDGSEINGTLDRTVVAKYGKQLITNVDLIWKKLNNQIHP